MQRLNLNFSFTKTHWEKEIKQPGVQIDFRQMAVTKKILFHREHYTFSAIAGKSFKQAFPDSKKFLYIYPMKCSVLGDVVLNFFRRSQKIYNGHHVIGTF